nr:insulinase family protein [Alphaproteobacteria bacterium]
RNDAINKSLDVIRSELSAIAEKGPTAEELDNAKSYLVGSYALRFDTSSKIASQLLGLMDEGFEPDYITNRNKMISDIKMEDVKRVAKKLLDMDNLIVTIVGKPEKPGDKS